MMAKILIAAKNVEEETKESRRQTGERYREIKTFLHEQNGNMALHVMYLPLQNTRRSPYEYYQAHHYTETIRGVATRCLPYLVSSFV